MSSKFSTTPFSLDWTPLSDKARGLVESVTRIASSQGLTDPVSLNLVLGRWALFAVDCLHLTAEMPERESLVMMMAESATKIGTRQEGFLNFVEEVHQSYDSWNQEELGQQASRSVDDLIQALEKFGSPLPPPPADFKPLSDCDCPVCLNEMPEQQEPIPPSNEGVTHYEGSDGPGPAFPCDDMECSYCHPKEPRDNPF